MGAAKDEVVRVSEARARDWATEVFVSTGMRSPEAALVADNLVTADCRGLMSHGLMRTRVYVERLKTGSIDPRATPEVAGQSGAVLIVDGRNAMGQVVVDFAVERAIEKAREHGIGVVGVRGSNHFGTCEYYAMKASAVKMIGIVATVSATNVMAPFGGVEGLLGNNPVGIAVPTGKAPPLVLDLAMSVAAGGKIRLAAETGQPIPQDWAIDAEGNPTTDPLAALEGTVLPMAGYKGYGMAFMVGVLAAILPGAAFGREVGDQYRQLSGVQNVGHFVEVLDISRFLDPNVFEQHVDAAIDLMHEARKAPGTDRILVPGEREYLISIEQHAHGIAYPRALVQDLNALATEISLAGLI